MRALSRVLFAASAVVLLLLWAPSVAAQRVDTLRFQIGDDWCFVKRPPVATDRAIVIIHGNGEVVEAHGSSWESRREENSLLEELADAGFVVAQSNAAAVPGNGMWGNLDTQRAVSALIARLRRVEHARHFDAVAISAGNLTLLNLMLRGTSFDHVVMLAPVTSLASLYRCPAGVNRVRQISRAFGFRPASGCPGDPEHDQAFLHATAGEDPGSVEQFTSSQIRLLRNARWMAIYEEHDPKVPPAENIVPWAARLQSLGVDVTRGVVPGGRQHTGPELFAVCSSRIVYFLKQSIR